MSAQRKIPAQSSDFSALVKSVSKIVSEMAGIQLAEKQFPMVENRLKSRMIRLSIHSPEGYLKYLKAHLEEESKELLSLLTTHHTYFFREFTHFEFLINSGLSALVKAARARGQKKIRVWSAAASRGQEVYSIAMFLDFHLKQVAPDFDFEIWGTDVDPQSMAIARNGVYPYKELKQVPSQYLGNHWVRGTGEISEYAKLKKSLANKAQFTTLNLVQPHLFQGSERFDLIFCRNVFIYFSPEQIKEVSKFLFSNLHPSGYLITGISEPLNGLGLKVKSIGPSVYQDATFDPVSVSPLKQLVQVPEPVEAVIPDRIRVLCVDDSPSIIALMKRILVKDQGFEVVATAGNGLEAEKILRTTTVDLVTLDIHMPEMDGISYLLKNMKEGHPPVVMISSVTRENSDLALQAIRLGAADYVEKPTMADLLERGEEIRMKAKLAAFTKKRTKGSDIGESFQRKFVLKNPEEKMQVMFASLSDLKKMSLLLSQFKGSMPLTKIVFDAGEELLTKISDELKQENPGLLFTVNSGNTTSGTIDICSFAKIKDQLPEIVKSKPTAAFVFGIPSKKVENCILSLPNLFLVMEDLGLEKKIESSSLIEVASAFTPATSYLSILEEHWK